VRLAVLFSACCPDRLLSLPTAALFRAAIALPAALALLLTPRAPTSPCPWTVFPGDVGSSVSWIGWGLSVAALLATPFTRGRTAPVLALAGLLTMMLGNGHTFQPYLYMAGLMLLPDACGRPQQREGTVLGVLSGMYLLAGLSKFSDEYEVILAFFRNVWPHGLLALERPLLLAAPFLEILGGLLLLTPLRVVVTVPLMVMHLALLALLVGADWNRSVWPWNAQLPLLLALVCHVRPFRPRFTVPVAAMLALALLSVLNVGPYSLRMNLYGAAPPVLWLGVNIGGKWHRVDASRRHELLTHTFMDTSRAGLTSYARCRQSAGERVLGFPYR